MVLKYKIHCAVFLGIALSLLQGACAKEPTNDTNTVQANKGITERDGETCQATLSYALAPDTKNIQVQYTLEKAPCSQGPWSVSSSGTITKKLGSLPIQILNGYYYRVRAQNMADPVHNLVFQIVNPIPNDFITANVGSLYYYQSRTVSFDGRADCGIPMSDCME